MGRRQSLGPMWRIWPWLTRTSRVALPPTSALYYAQRRALVHQFSQRPSEFARVATAGVLRSSALSSAAGALAAGLPGPMAVPQVPAGAV
jgi:hypothetical protein